MLVGSRGGWIINHVVVLGGGGYGLVSSVTAPQQAQPALGRYDLSFGYGGVIIEGIILPMRAWHLSVVWEPTLSLELNLVSFMRIDVGAGYRVGGGAPRAGQLRLDRPVRGGDVQVRKVLTSLGPCWPRCAR